MPIHGEPVEKAFVALSFDQRDSVPGGILEMNALEFRDLREAVRNFGEGIINRHGRKRTDQWEIAVDAFSIEFLQRQ